MNTYPVNDLVRLSVLFTDLQNADAPVDPTTVTLTLTPPLGAAPIVIDSGIVRDSAGAYHYDYVFSTMGQWIYRFQGSGAVIASSGNGFILAI